MNAVINGPTHTAIDGDIINVPSGSCTWTSGVTVSGIGISIIGSGTPSASPSVMGASASCASTQLTVTGTTLFTITPSFGNATTRISCMKVSYGSGSSEAWSILGSCTSSGCPNVRIDNVTLPNWAPHTGPISYGIYAIGNMFGVIDHNTVTGTPNDYLQLVEFSHASYLGVGSWGDKAWSQPEAYGTANFLFIENNVFNDAGATENEGSAGGLSDQGGGRVVIRYNQFTNMDHLNGAMIWHGTESSGRPRSTRTWEFYGNQWSCAASTQCNLVGGPRGGTGITWGNSNDSSASGASLSNFFLLATYRAFASIAPWGACDGSAPYDTNDGVTYFSGTIGSISGTGPSNDPYVITPSGGSPGWTTNQWIPAGAPYSVHDVTLSNGAEISANTSSTVSMIDDPNAPGGWIPMVGDSIQILRATVCIDQAGGRGAGILYSSANPATSTPANEVSSPIYMWSNTFSGSVPSPDIMSNTARVIRNRDFYTENPNQSAQSNSTTPFDGTTTIGAGHGTLANRPTTCTAGVSYWATDQGNWNNTGSGQGQLYICTATNTWTLSYTPYSYPHPLTAIVGSSAVPSGVIMSGVF